MTQQGASQIGLEGAGGEEHEAGSRSMGEQQQQQETAAAGEEPPSHWDMWITTLDLASDMAEVLKDGVEEEVAMVYEALDQTFKWNERRRERVENAHNELIRLNRQIDAKKDALQKLKSASTARENQAEIYALEQSAYEEARKIKEFDAGIGSIKAHTSKLQTQIQELEQSDSTRSPDFVIGASVCVAVCFCAYMKLLKTYLPQPGVTREHNNSSSTLEKKLSLFFRRLKTKLYHDLGFVQVRSPLQDSTNAPDPDKLFIRMLFPKGFRNNTRIVVG